MDRDVADELREAGLPRREAEELADLAAEIAALPETAPRRRWLLESKWRLMRKFDEQQDERAAGPEDESAK